MKKIFLLTLMMILIAGFVNAVIEVNIEVKHEYKIGEDVKFSYTITSDKDETIGYSPHINCPDAPIAFLESRTTELKANIPLEEEYSYYSKLKDDIEPQECAASVSVTFPIKQKVEKNFTIKTNPSFSFDIILAKKIFILKDTIKLDYNSEVSNPKITLTLTFPDKTTEQITLPYSFKPSQLGTYELEATASKEGYKTIKRKTQFGVIEKEADIPYVELGKAKKGSLVKWVIIISSVIIILVIIGYVIHRRKRYYL